MAARRSSFWFKDKKADLKEIADKLNVEHVLEGSVRREGNRVRISAELTDCCNVVFKVAGGFRFSIRLSMEIPSTLRCASPINDDGDKADATHAGEAEPRNYRLISRRRRNLARHCAAPGSG